MVKDLMQRAAGLEVNISMAVGIFNPVVTVVAFFAFGATVHVNTDPRRRDGVGFEIAPACDTSITHRTRYYIMTYMTRDIDAVTIILEAVVVNDDRRAGLCCATQTKYKNKRN